MKDAETDRYMFRYLSIYFGRINVIKLIYFNKINKSAF